MMADKDYYKILGVDKGADEAALKSAYRKMAMQYHPDRNKDNPEAEAKFKELNEAYDVLKDPQKRAAYDRFGSAAFDGRGNGGGAAGGGFEGFGGSFSDIFEDMFGDIMGQRGGAGRQRYANAAERGADMQYTLEISLEDAYKGKETTIKVPVHETCTSCKGSGAEPGSKPEKCPTCDGAGRVRMQQGFFMIERTCPTCGGAGTAIKDPCKACNGAGRVRREKTLKVTIPAGVDSGRRIRLTGEGEGGLRGGPSGDLYILLIVRPHKFFKRDNADLYCRVPIPMTTATLGGAIEAPTIDGGKTSVKIPSGTQSGQQFRLRGKGMSILKSSSRGDMYIEVHVETPVNLNRKQQDLLRQLDETMSGAAGSRNSPESSGFFKKMKDVWSDLTD